MVDKVIRNLESDVDYGENKIIKKDCIFTGSSILFRGKNNILYIEDGANISGVVIKFLGDNSLVYIGKSKTSYAFQLNIFHDSVFYMGSGNSFSGKKPIFQLSERKNIFIGDDNMFSYGVSVRVADPHLIYSIESFERINPSKSVYIGDHVWLGQNVTIFKGNKIGSGSILGGESLITKNIPSNVSAGGNPVRVIKEGIFWLRPAVHAFKKEHTDRWASYHKDDFIYSKETETSEFDNIENFIIQDISAKEKLEFLKALPKDKNRFYL
ncbi:acyltransferase [Weissella paramesenteroides]|uniref:acyltransferase n=1 Tax=Weissella paramesenteroides TaxID=1249 RepID=UPI0023A9E132|nr:acyltransferase [Weissella paramesenteroides]WEA53651.1 acyltransferase [Weissella paramesenteroides]